MYLFSLLTCSLVREVLRVPPLYSTRSLMAPDGVNNLRSSHCESGCHVRRNSPLRLKQLCQIRLQHRPLLCHVRQRCGLSLSTEASVCAVETGPGQVICAPLTHVTVTCKDAARRRTTAARGGSWRRRCNHTNGAPNKAGMSPGNMTRPARRQEKKTMARAVSTRVMRLVGRVICGSTVGLRSSGVGITARPRGFPGRERICAVNRSRLV